MVNPVADGEAALLHLKTYEYDATVIDCRLPKPDESKWSSGRHRRRAADSNVDAYGPETAPRSYRSRIGERSAPILSVR